MTAQDQSEDFHSSPYDLGCELPDGRIAIDGGDGRYYLPGDDGWPDWDKPVYIPGLSRESPKRGDLVIRLEDYK